MRTFLAVAGVAIAAFAAGWLAGRGGVAVPGAPAPPAAASADDAAAGGGVVPAHDPARREERAADGRTTPRPRAGGAAAGIPEFTLNLPPVDLPPSPETITGTIVDDTGAPVAGARVWAEPDLPRELYDDDPDDAELVRAVGTLDEEIARARAEAETDLAERIAWLRRQVPLRRETLTGPDGTFVLRDLVDGEYDLGAHVPGCAVETPLGSTAYDVRPGGRVSFVATPLVPVLVDVLLEDGTAPNRAAVFANDPGDDPSEYAWSSRFLPWTPSRRTILAPRGRRSFRARVGDRLSEIVEADAGPPDAHVALTLRRVGTLRVLAEGGGAAPDLHAYTVVARRTDGAGEPLTSGFDQHGAIRWDAVPQGAWKVSLGYEGGRTLEETAAALGPGGASVRLRLPPPGPRDGFPLRVVGDDGAPVPDVEIEFESDDGMAPLALPRGPGKWFVLRRHAAGPLRVVAERGDDERVVHEVGASHSGEVVLRLAPRTDVEIAVPPDLEDARFALAEVGSSRRDGTVAVGGVARFDGVRAGRYEVSSPDAPAAGVMRIDVPTPRVAFRPTPHRALRVTHLWDECPAASWGLREGDLVVGIDGEAFRNGLHLDAVRAAAALRESVTLDVLRDGARLRFAAEPLLLRDDDSGATFEPVPLD